MRAGATEGGAAPANLGAALGVLQKNAVAVAYCKRGKGEMRLNGEHRSSRTERGSAALEAAADTAAVAAGRGAERPSRGHVAPGSLWSTGAQGGWGPQQDGWMLAHTKGGQAHPQR